MDSKKLSIKDYCGAAKALNCSVAAIMAVADVESAGDGFLPDGRIKIRFEGHKFRLFTHGRYDHSHSHLSYPYRVQHSKAHGYSAFNEAFALDPTAALLATSFGKFQPMGFTFEEAGFDDVHEFVEFLKQGEGAQLQAFVKLVKYRHLADELQREDFTGFAKNYNGESFKDNDYDGKMRKHCSDHKRAKIDCERLFTDDEIEQATSGFEANQFTSSLQTEQYFQHTVPSSNSSANDTGDSINQDSADNTAPQLPSAESQSSAQSTSFVASETVQTPTGEASVTVEQNTFAADSFKAYIPQIDTARTWLKRSLAGSVLAGVWAYISNAPVHIQVGLLALVVTLVVGAIYIFKNYHKEVFAFVTEMNRQRAQPETHNPEVDVL